MEMGTYEALQQYVATKSELSEEQLERDRRSLIGLYETMYDDVREQQRFNIDLKRDLCGGVPDPNDRAADRRYAVGPGAGWRMYPRSLRREAAESRRDSVILCYACPA